MYRMKTLHHDARAFVSDVVRYVHSEQGGSAAFPKMQTLLSRLSRQARGEQEAKVESSVILASDEKRELEQSLTGLIGHPLTISYVVTPTLLGGLRIALGDLIVDTSLASQLAAMGESLKGESPA